MSADPRTKRELMQQAFEHAPLGTILSGLNGRALAANPAACRMLGYDEAELLDIDLQAITHPGDSEVDVIGLQDLLAGRVESFTVAKRFVRKSGETARIYQTVSLARDRKMRPRFFVSQLRDVTVESRTERQNDVLFRLSPDMLAVTPSDIARLDRVNPAWQRTLGWTSEDLATRPFLDFIHPTQREEAAALAEVLRHERTARSFRNLVRGKDGEYRWLEWNTYPRDGHRYCVVRDISHRQAIEQELRDTNQRLVETDQQLSSVVDNIGDGLITFDANGTVHSFNTAASRMFGYTAAQIVGGSIEMLLTERMRDARVGEIQAHLQGGEPQLVGKGHAVLPAVRKDGSIIHLEAIVNALPTTEGELFVAVMRDVTERRKAEAELFADKERLRVTLESIGDGVITTDTHGCVTYLNPVAERMTGWSNEEAIGQTLPTVLVLTEEGSPDPPPNPVDIVLRDGVVAGLTEDSILERRGGGRFAIEDSAAPIKNARDDVIGAVLVFHDVSEARRIAAEMTHQASHDPLTGLVNRRGFERRLDAALKQNEVSQGEMAVLFMDLDQFKLVNDTGGHVAGDELLKRLAGVFRRRLRQADTLARLGGDEFGVILENCSADGARRIAESLRQAITHYPFVWEEHTFHVGVSIGLVLASGGVGREEMLRRADAACYLAKDRGRNRIHVYKHDDQRRIRRRGEIGWIARIHQALEENRFVLCRQASVELPTARSAHFETLLRMMDTNGKLVMPMTFIPSAERYGLMPEIDRWVVSEAMRKLAAEEHDDEICFINLSGASVGDESFTEFVRSQVEASGVRAEGVCFEVTETAAIANLAHAEAMIGDIKKLGCRFALDDFGSGMSSFAYLKHLPVDYLKIDGTFVKHMDQDPIDRAMVEAINNIGHVMGIETIAEYVENQATVDILAGMGVNYAQGYWIEKPQLWT